jgi:predicted dehydrogenase
MVEMDQQGTTPVRFGVLGTGRITRRLVAELQQNEAVRVTAIASRDASRAAWYADQFGIPAGLQGYQRLVESDDVDAVYVALPPAEHARWAVAALSAGKHVLCEKPLALSGTEAESIDRAAREHGVHWLDATAWPHHPRTARMAEIISGGSLGALRHISVSVSFYEPFQSGDHRLDAELGGGCLLDLGWYAAGWAVWAAGGAVPERVQASGRWHRNVWYRVTAVADFPGDVSAAIHCGYDVATRKWTEVAGTEASLICDDFTRPWQQRPPRFWVHDRAGDVTSETLEGQQEQAMITRFCDALRGGADLQPLQHHALATQQTLDMIAAALGDAC